MKKLRIIALISIFVFISADSFGGSWYQEWRSDRQQKLMQGKGKKQGEMSFQKGKRLENPGGQQTGAPIDGGLLTLLAASGIAVYGAKKKKKALEN